MAQTATVKEPTAEKIAIARGVMQQEYSFKLKKLDINPPRYVTIGNHFSPQVTTGMFERNRDPARKTSEIIVPVDQFPTKLSIGKRYQAYGGGMVIEFYAFDASLIPTVDSDEEDLFNNPREQLFESRPDLVQLVDIFHSLPTQLYRRFGQYNHPSFSSARFTSIRTPGADFRVYFHTKTDVAQLQGRVLEVRVNGTAKYDTFLFPEITPTLDQ